MPALIDVPDAAVSPLSARLSSFLRCRLDRAAPFFLGHWLQVEDGDTLSHVRAAIKAFDDREVSPTTDDLLTFVVIAVAAETQRAEHALDHQIMSRWIDGLRVAEAIERYRRKGWLVLARPLSVQAEA